MGKSTMEEARRCVCLRKMPSRGEGMEECEDIHKGVGAMAERMVRCAGGDTLATVIKEGYGIDQGRWIRGSWWRAGCEGPRRGWDK